MTLTHLTKSLFLAGYQCPKLLWWKVHDAGAVELQPDKVTQDLFDQGRQVGELARDRFPGGILIDAPHHARDRKGDATRDALTNGADTIFEASVEASGVFASADVLLKDSETWTLIEVKSSSSVKEVHIPDAAVQAWVLQESGVPVSRIDIMHLNKEYRHPGQPGVDLLARTDVTAEVRNFLPQVPALIGDMATVIEGPLPDHPIGAHCFAPRECPFMGRCWPDDPDHIGNLYNTGPKRTVEFMAQGVHSIWDIPPTKKLPFAAQRQLRALREDRLIVEPTLAAELEAFRGPLGFLDFETVTRAVPVWDGLAPWGQAAAQFSYHQEKPEGGYSHLGWLAEGPGDPRKELAERMLAATADARGVVVYTSFEKTRIKELARLVPEYETPLLGLVGKLVDLHPVVRDHVYHPAFRGSFSIKYVLNPLVPDLTYDDLVIVNGLVASVEIARLLFVAHKIPTDERARVRQDLLNYCERDTWAMVRLLERLRELVKR